MNNISEFDNGLDDLDDCWDDRSIDSDESFDFSSGVVKKAKISEVKAVKVDPPKKKKKSEVSADKKGKSSLRKIGENPKAKVTALKAVAADTKATTPKAKPDAADSEPFGNAGESSFPLDQFDLTESTVLLLKERGIESLFPIQAETYWPIRQVKDLIGRARTGQGECEHRDGHY